MTKYFYIYCLFILICSCDVQTSLGLNLKEGEFKEFDYYLKQFNPEKVELNPLEEDWYNGNITLLIINNDLVQITEKKELTNISYADTLATLLWYAVEDKAKYKMIKIGFIQTSEKNNSEILGPFWLEYNTNSIK